ncbi:uncharacterized protein MONBRDRAFT_30979 [Monosiga brevicollis MX1]|uniref:SAM domain-containing protein n=1 Tax=Monosiga brevicollis TaxID=81824 RepID=A9UQJ0_MONBE|nr:uncharacterized protein MONBRDRAFT_30979 [Monosiga brevicollis MX1]EDQ92607.1 predicted protein [Monosiga brevicollis MX1]|eukprot:XP_001742369.1 hypothetical protein [Monosiga brevicollis MX1]
MAESMVEPPLVASPDAEPETLTETDTETDHDAEVKPNPAFSWTTTQVANFITEAGFERYAACFTENFVDGQKLQYIDATQLNRLGVRDFEDIKAVAAIIRQQFQHPIPDSQRSITEVTFATH